MIAGIFLDIAKAIAWLSGIAYGTAKFFDWLDPMLNDRARKSVTRWLTNIPSNAKHDSYIAVFSKLIDKVFGAKALSIKFIFRSCVASTLSVLTVMVIYFNGGGQSRMGLYQYIQSGGVLHLLPLVVLINYFPDYLSLLITRFLVRLVGQASNARSIVALLAVDTVVTSVLSASSLFFGGALLLTLVHTIVSLNQFVSQHPGVEVNVTFNTVAVFINCCRSLWPGFSMFRWLIFGVEHNAVPSARVFEGPLAILFYSAFGTSLWLWLYVLAGFVIRVLSKIGHLWQRFVPYLDLERKPLQAVGRVAGISAASLWGLIKGGALIATHLHR